ncbi:hypothetical protein BGX23_010770 [Mortierella sp. AD031]|nr:hypothetical protein BGX23_010770 [Mortierella sp. AD031]KAG0214745.1 hypothetical protein BGX33_001862 [Mortierella sp. NVP41]
MEDDFPFGFGGGGSDQEENGDDGLFCAPKKKAAAKAKALLSQEPYYAQIDEEGWFHSTGKSTFELMTQDKTGATKVKMRADHYYMLHRYQEAFDIAQEFCSLIRTNGLTVSQGGDGGLRRPDEGATADTGVLRVSDPKEMQELALRCALKLNMFDMAAKLADELILQDTGVVFLKAKAYEAVGRFSDAALGLVQYQKTRTGNYSIWRTLGECLHQSTLPSGPSGSPITTPIPAAAVATEALPSLENLSIASSSFSSSQRPNVVHILALMCILRARHLMRASTWAQVPYAQARFDNEMSVLDEQRLTLERKCALDLEITGGEEQMQSVGTLEGKRLKEYERKVVVPAQRLLEGLVESGATSLDQDRGSFSLEVVGFVIRSWDQQVIVQSGPGMPADDEDLAGVSVRDK